jgi:hypothetical protein
MGVVVIGMAALALQAFLVAVIMGVAILVVAVVVIVLLALCLVLVVLVPFAVAHLVEAVIRVVRMPLSLAAVVVVLILRSGDISAVLGCGLDRRARARPTFDEPPVALYLNRLFRTFGTASHKSFEPAAWSAGHPKARCVTWRFGQQCAVGLARRHKAAERHMRR